MNGILAVNHFLKGEKFDTLHQHLMNSAAEMGIDLKLKTNLQLGLEIEQADFVLFWDKDITLAKRIEMKNIPVFNSASSIEQCDNKALTYISLENTVPQPKTLISPKTFFVSDMREFVEKAVEIIGLPLVFKECFGSFGEQVWLCNSTKEIYDKISDKPFILQQFIESSSGEDIRIEVIAGKCVSAVKRKNEHDFRSNVTNGGTMTPYVPTKNEEQLAVDACKKLGLTFAGVDILKGDYVCEVNSNAHIINIMNSTGIDIAPLIFAEIERKVHERNSDLF